ERGAAGERGKERRVGDGGHTAEDVVEEDPNEPDRDLNRGVADERLPDTLAAARRERGAERHAAQVDDEDDDLRVGAVADEEAQVTAPDGLVDEPRGAGEDEDGDEQEGHGLRTYGQQGGEAR